MFRPLDSVFNFILDIALDQSRGESIVKEACRVASNGHIVEYDGGLKYCTNGPYP